MGLPHALKKEMEAESLSSVQTLTLSTSGSLSSNLGLHKLCSLQPASVTAFITTCYLQDSNRAGGMEMWMQRAKSPRNSKTKLGTFFRKKRESRFLQWQRCWQWSLELCCSRGSHLVHSGTQCFWDVRTESKWAYSSFSHLLWGGLCPQDDVELLTPIVCEIGSVWK